MAKEKRGKKGHLRVAAVQAKTCPDPDQNAQRKKGFFRRSKKKDVRVICFLEGYLPFYDFDLIRARKSGYAEKIRSGIQQARDLAKAYMMWCVVGMVTPKKGKWSNDAYLIAPTGRIRGVYTKIFTLDSERRLVAQGDSLPTWRIEGATVGGQICNDQKHQEGWQVLAQKRCDVVFHPMFGNGKRKLNLYENGAQMCRAWENGMFVVTANAISTKPGTHQFALSQIIGPDGRPLARAKPETETLLVADLDLNQSAALRERARKADRKGVFGSVAFTGSG